LRSIGAAPRRPRAPQRGAAQRLGLSSRTSVCPPRPLCIPLRQSDPDAPCEGISPGPTLEVRSGERILVSFHNRLPSLHILPLDASTAGDAHMSASLLLSQSRGVTHLHGGHTAPHSDGLPLQWWTSPAQGSQAGNDFVHRTFDYYNTQPTAHLFYHDHADMITRLNFYAGLVGHYFVRDGAEAGLGLPSGDREIPITLQVSWIGVGRGETLRFEPLRMHLPRSQASRMAMAMAMGAWQPVRALFPSGAHSDCAPRLMRGCRLPLRMPCHARSLARSLAVRPLCTLCALRLSLARAPPLV